MHFPEEIERIYIVAVDTVLRDQAKYLILISLKSPLALLLMGVMRLKKGKNKLVKKFQQWILNSESIAESYS